MDIKSALAASKSGIVEQVNGSQARVGPGYTRLVTGGMYILFDDAADLITSGFLSGRESPLHRATSAKEGWEPVETTPDILTDDVELVDTLNAVLQAFSQRRKASSDDGELNDMAGRAWDLFVDCLKYYHMVMD